MGCFATRDIKRGEVILREAATLLLKRMPGKEKSIGGRRWKSERDAPVDGEELQDLIYEEFQKLQAWQQEKFLNARKTLFAGYNFSTSGDEKKRAVWLKEEDLERDFKLKLLCIFQGNNFGTGVVRRLHRIRDVQPFVCTQFAQVHARDSLSTKVVDCNARYQSWRGIDCELPAQELTTHHPLAKSTPAAGVAGLDVID